ncbi:L-serine ammonia-lyase [Amycolatopsis acidiphila]|uniref:L-serine dehydratase n=1 Tax=Amycolatopsis acidiphila TaxID=715473 RepID=A0A557ZYB6_9PSEU|nr:L-serine ammonia-lyase [Amycolatopsis acidiphila]TVT17015.1 L-serine ammonia-lyase [Amycolatopsis acidiphila]UIJ58577.1 L-serine ammonia-lyase [Amycolatopsis acidiphila]GHG76732.1 L-serine dehydratase [Amycolatopsis acidiphila]
MAISVFDLFSIGIGPSSSHTVGPMRAAGLFLESLGDLRSRVRHVRVELFGSLGATGHGHGSERAVLLGLSGEKPETVAIDAEPSYDFEVELVLHRRKSLPAHPNGMIFRAYGDDLLAERTYYSVGGGFVRGEQGITEDATPLPFPFSTGAQLLAHTREQGVAVSEIMLRNELAWRSREEIRAGLLRIWDVMAECVRNGCEPDGVLPGGLKVRRRAKSLHAKLLAEGDGGDSLQAMDWVSLYALAVNEENAAGGRVVTAPTNGAAGIIPAVLHYYRRFVRDAGDDGVVRFLLTAGAIGVVLKTTGSISGAEVGCQGEVGSACAMAAAGLTEVMGGSPEQVENAAEIGVEHHLGLTCDPVGGLVQIPCIERNAVAASTAIHAARMAMRGDGGHVVTLDKAIKTMRETGADMKVKYKETARGGLAVNVIEC